MILPLPPHFSLRDRVQRRSINAAGQTHIDVPVARNFESRDARDGRNGGYQFLRNLARCFAQLPGKLEGNRNGEFAERILLWLLQPDSLLDLKLGGERLLNFCGQSRFDFLEHLASSMPNTCETTTNEPSLQ